MTHRPEAVVLGKHADNARLPSTTQYSSLEGRTHKVVFGDTDLAAHEVRAAATILSAGEKKHFVPVSSH